MFRPLPGTFIAVALALPTAAAAQVQVNQNFLTQGPAPSFGLTDITQSRDAPPNGHVAGAVGPVIADPVDANTLFIGTPGGESEDDERRNDLDLAHGQAGVALDFEVLFAGRGEHLDLLGRGNPPKRERGRGCCAWQCVGGRHLRNLRLRDR